MTLNVDLDVSFDNIGLEKEIKLKAWAVDSKKPYTTHDENFCSIVGALIYLIQRLSFSILFYKSPGTPPFIKI